MTLRALHKYMGGRRLGSACGRPAPIFGSLASIGLAIMLGACAGKGGEQVAATAPSAPQEAPLTAAVAVAPTPAATTGMPGTQSVDPDAVSTFVRAARFGQAQAVKFHLERELPVDVRDDLGNTALIAAAAGGHADILQTLIEAGADPQVSNREGRTALMAAAIRGDAKMIQLLIQQGADANAHDAQGETALFDAVRYGHFDAVRLLLEAGAKADLQTQRSPASGEAGYTPLMYAAKRGLSATVSARDWVQIAAALLDNKADPDIRNARGESALSIATNAGHVDVAALLTQRGAKQVLTYAGLGLDDALIAAATDGDAQKVSESLNGGADPNAATRAGVTPLLAAAYGGNVDAVRALVERGADINVVPNGFRAWTWTGAKMSTEKQALAQAASMGDTALILASRLGQQDVVAYLLENGADPSKPNPHDDTPLGVAAEQGHADIVALLLAKKVQADEGRLSTPAFTGSALVGMKTDERNTPLIKAALGGHEAAARALLEAGADPNIRGFAGKTALFWAAERGHAALVTLLLQHEATPNIKTNAGLTPLMEAAKSGRLSLVQELISHEADLDAREGGDVLPGTLDVSAGTGMTALMFAAVGGHANVVQVLLDAGADTSIRNRSGQTALEEALKSGHEAIVQQLRGVSVAAGR